jgi:hypothetical protein
VSSIAIAIFTQKMASFQVFSFQVFLITLLGLFYYKPLYAVLSPLAPLLRAHHSDSQHVGDRSDALLRFIPLPSSLLHPHTSGSSHSVVV